MTPFASEMLGSAVLALLGTSVACNSRLARTSGVGMPFAAMAAGWGAAFAVSMLVVGRTGGQLNPAVTLAMWLADRSSGADAAARIGAQFAGTAVGMALACVAFLPQLSRGGETSAALYRVPEVRAPLANLVASAVASGAFVLLMLRLVAGDPIPGDAEAAVEEGTPVATMVPFVVAHLGEASLLAGLGFFAVLVGLGGSGAPVTPTLGICGRVLHLALPIPGKDRTDWRDAWLSLAGPALGAVVASAAWRVTT